MVTHLFRYFLPCIRTFSLCLIILTLKCHYFDSPCFSRLSFHLFFFFFYRRKRDSKYILCVLELLNYISPLLVNSEHPITSGSSLGS